MELVQKWFWEKAGFSLAILVIAGLLVGWFVPQIALIIAIAEIALAIVVIIKETRGMGA